jgi:hypothetical protein
MTTPLHKREPFPEPGEARQIARALHVYAPIMKALEFLRVIHYLYDGVVHSHTRMCRNYCHPRRLPHPG